jgi:HEPN domain-containing protein
LKALHYRRGARVVLGHSLAELLHDLLPERPDLGDLREAARQLDQYYIPTRDPNGSPGRVPAEPFTPNQATEAVAYVRLFIARARTILGERLR